MAHRAAHRACQDFGGLRCGQHLNTHLLDSRSVRLSDSRNRHAWHTVRMWAQAWRSDATERAPRPLGQDRHSVPRMALTACGAQCCDLGHIRTIVLPAQSVTLAAWRVAVRRSSVPASTPPGYCCTERLRLPRVR